MSEGIPILDTITKKCEVEQINKFNFRITLTEGLNRQIRRMCAHLNYEVYKLKRIRIMNLNLDLPYGEWRYLSKIEMKEMNAMLAKSHKKFD